MHSAVAKILQTSVAGSFGTIHVYSYGFNYISRPCPSAVERIKAYQLLVQWYGGSSFHLVHVHCTVRAYDFGGIMWNTWERGYCVPICHIHIAAISMGTGVQGPGEGGGVSCEDPISIDLEPQ